MIGDPRTVFLGDSMSELLPPILMTLYQEERSYWAAKEIRNYELRSLGTRNVPFQKERP